MRVLASFLFVIHGFAHLVGFVVPWRIMDLTDSPYKTTVLGDKIDLGDKGIRILGLLWLFTAIAFFIMGTGVLLERDWWVNATIVVSGFSFLLCILGWPQTRIGLFLGVFI